MIKYILTQSQRETLSSMTRGCDLVKLPRQAYGTTQVAIIHGTIGMGIELGKRGSIHINCRKDRSYFNV